MDHSTNAYLKQARVFKEFVWYEEDTAISEGDAVCYNYDYGTNTDREGQRLNRVEDPTTSNAQWFAGVSVAAHSANTGGQFIEIYKPGSVCNVLVGASTAIGVGFLTFDVTAATIGQFRRMGLPGRGSAQPLQTTTYVATAQLCLCYLMEGPESGGAQDLTATAGARTDQMVGGTTCYIGASIAQNQTLTLADGTIPGLRKKFMVVDTELTTASIVITVSNGVTDDIDDVDLASITFTHSATCLDTQATVEWDGGWILTGMTKGEPLLA